MKKILYRLILKKKYFMDKMLENIFFGNNFKKYFMEKMLGKIFFGNNFEKY